MQTAQPSPDFKDASTPPKKRLGYNGEITHWIEQNFTLVEAVEHSYNNWGFTSRLRIKHEVSHIVLGLLHYTHPITMGGKPYQGDVRAECCTTGIESHIQFPTRGREGFIKSVCEEARLSGYTENSSRILLWLLAPPSGKTIEDLKKMESVVLVYDARRAGIEVDYAFRDEGKTIVTIKSPVHGVFKAAQSYIEFPENFSRKEDIVPFSISSDEAGYMFDALEPALDFLREEYSVHKDQAFSKIRVGQIVELLKTGASSQPKRDAVRGMDVQPA